MKAVVLRRDLLENWNRWLAGEDMGIWSSFVLSPDGSALAAWRCAGTPDRDGLWVIAADDLEATRFNFCFEEAGLLQLPIDSARWSRDGAHLAVITSQGQPPAKGSALWIVPVSSQGQPRLLYRAKGHLGGYLWSPDGSSIAVVDWGNGLIVLGLDGSRVCVDAHAMGYPLGANAMTWLVHPQRLQYVTLQPGQEGLWVWQPDGHKKHLIALPEDEVLLPAGVPCAHDLLWGALRGHLREWERGVVFYWQNAGDSTLDALSLPDVSFDPASALLPNDNGSLWACTVWQKGRRVPYVIDRTAGRGKQFAVPAGVVSELAGWDGQAQLWMWTYPPALVALDVCTTRWVPGQVGAREGVATQFSLELTAAELGVLLQSLNLPGMLDLSLPWSGLSTPELQQIQRDVYASLAAKGYLTSVKDGTRHVDLTVAALVGCCASAEQAWTVTAEPPSGERTVYHVYYAQGLYVEDAVVDGKHCLTPLQDKDRVRERMAHRWQIETETSCVTRGEVTLAEEAFFRIRDITQVNGAQAAQRYLHRAGMDHDASAALAQALAQPVMSGSASRWVVFGGQPTEIETGFSILAGPDSLWLLEPVLEGEVNSVRISSARRDEIEQRLASLLIISE